MRLPRKKKDTGERRKKTIIRIPELLGDFIPH
jgi:hypothetical protein